MQNGVIGPYNAEIMWNFTKEMVRFFAKMQRMDLNHRDIKPGNIMVKKVGNTKKFKVIDFGYSLKSSPYAIQSITGTEDYASPKIRFKFANTNEHISALTEKDDVYSLGIFLSNLLGKTILELMRVKKSSNDDIKPRLFEKLKKLYDPNILHLLSKMLEPEEDARWDFIRTQAEILKI